MCRGSPRAVEVYAACAVPDLSAYALEVDGGLNGGGFTFPKGRSAAAGDVIHLAFKV